MKKKLSLEALQSEAASFAGRESTHWEKSIFGTTDGKAVGTYLEQKFQRELGAHYDYEIGNAAKGIDFPGLDVDIKVTSIRQPQSSCPFRSARQKIYGLGYSLLVFVYDKTDDRKRRAGRLDIRHVIFVRSDRTGDFQTTSGLRRLIENKANKDDIIAFFAERMLPLEEIGADKLADEVLAHPPVTGSLTISNALQWRLQYSRVIEQAGSEEGIIRVR